MPADEREAERIYRTYDGQNGRYYILADVVFADGDFVRDIVFHGDTNIAAALQSHRPVPSQLYGREIKMHLVVRDCSGGSNTIADATDEERELFQQQNAG